MRVRLDRTLCDGFGICAKHAPEYFSLDDWGYASLTGNGSVPDADHDAVKRALLDCPVHAIVEMADRPDGPPATDRSESQQPHTGDEGSTVDDRDDDFDEPLREAQMMPGM